MSDLNLIAELDWCPACNGADWEPGDVDLCERHSAIEEDDMTDPTPAEIDAGAEALHGDQCPEDTDDGATCCTCDASHYDRAAAAVLRAVLPDHDARLRVELARELERRDS